MTTTLDEPWTLAATRTSRNWTELPGNFDRLNTRALYPSSNQWGIPDLPAATMEPARLIAYNAKTACLNAQPGSAVHFFLDDYRFETVWTKPVRPLARLRHVGAALTPDFSLWRSMPLAMQLWQTYRARWCGRWMLDHGIDVVPTVSWSTEASFEFCFAGIAHGSIVAVSAVGVRDKQAQSLFAAGYEAMVDRLRPALVLVYGPSPRVGMDVPERCYPTRWR